MDRSGDGDGVAPEDAHAARDLLEYDGDREEWRTSRRLEEYLDSKWGIELDAGAGPAQAELPTGGAGRTGDEPESRVAGSGSPDAPARSETTVVQVDLHGRDASETVDELASEAHVEHNAESGQHGRATHVTAREDARQATLAAFTSRVRVGRLARPGGSVYDAGAAVTFA